MTDCSPTLIIILVTQIINVCVQRKIDGIQRDINSDFMQLFSSPEPKNRYPLVYRIFS